MKFIIFLLLSFNIPAYSLSLESKVISVYDGDTFTISERDIIGKNYRIRIRDIDTAEYGWRAQCEYETKMSVKAKDFLTDLILEKTVQLKDLSTDKYGRLLADVYVDKINVGKELLRNKLAQEYKVNQRKPEWCK